MNYKNEYLSHSRMDQFRKCPKAFEFSYVKGERGQGTDATKFGSTIHAVLERLYKRQADEEIDGVLDEKLALQWFDEAFAKEGLTDQGLYQEGRTILRQYIAKTGIVESLSILAVEREFDLVLAGGFRFKGFIDRIEVLAPGHVEVIDYKTNRQPYTHEELDESIQLSIYHRVVRELYPWVNKVSLSFWMLRHGYKQFTERTDEQVQEHLDYLVHLGHESEKGVYPARLNNLCGWCDHKGKCEAFQQALQGNLTLDLSLDEGLAGVAQKRAFAAATEKAAKSLKDECDEQLKVAVGTSPDGEVNAGGYKARYTSSESYSYDLDKTVELLGRHTNLPALDCLKLVADVDSKKLAAFVATLDTSIRGVVEVELKVGAGTSKQSRRFYFTESKAPKKGAAK